MANELVKSNRQQSVWVPPVEIVRRTPVVTRRPIGTYTLVSSEIRSILPKGWVQKSNINPGGSITKWVEPGTRELAGGYYEVWKPNLAKDGTYVVETRGLTANDYVETIVWDVTVEVVTPGYWLTGAEDSWRATAHSLAHGSNPWELEFSVPTLPDGVVAGIALHGAPAAEDARQRIAHGFWVAGGTVLLWNNPAAAAAVPAEIITLTNTPAWTPETVYKVQGANGVLTWLVNGSPVARTVDSTAGQEVMMAAVLYGLDDSVSNPAFRSMPEASAFAELEFVSRASERAGGEGFALLELFSGGNDASNYVELEFFGLGHERGSYGQSTLPWEFFSAGLGFMGSAAIGAAALEFEAWSHGYPDGSGFGWAELEFESFMQGGSQATEAKQLVVGIADVQADTFGGVIAFEEMRGQDSITTSIKRNAPITVRVSVQDRLQAARQVLGILQERMQVDVDMEGRRLLAGSIFEVMQGQDAVHVGFVLDAAVGDALQVDAALQADRLMDSEILEAMAAQAGVEPQMLLSALIQELVGVTVLQELGAPTQVWSVTDQGRSSEESTNYTDYPFTQFANIGGRYFGAAEDGLYELEGNTDHGAPIEAAIDLGQRDLGTDAIKMLSNAYVSVNADAPMRLRVELNGQQYTYMTRGVSPQMQTQRFDLGRGLRGHFFGLQLVNTDGADFELGGLEFVAQESKRRI